MVQEIGKRLEKSRVSLFNTFISDGGLPDRSYHCPLGPTRINQPCGSAAKALSGIQHFFYKAPAFSLAPLMRLFKIFSKIIVAKGSQVAVFKQAVFLFLAEAVLTQRQATARL